MDAITVIIQGFMFVDAMLPMYIYMKFGLVLHHGADEPYTRLRRRAKPNDISESLDHLICI
jgi:hypothetical protein